MRSLLWFVLCVGCGAATVGGGSATPEPPPAEPWVFSTLPPGAHAEPTAMLADGEAWVIAFGPVRVRVDGEAIEVAEEVTASAIADIAAFDGVWLFVTAAGEVFSAAAPLAELSPVGMLDGRPLGSVVSSAAHLAILDDRGHLFVGDASGITRVETEGPVVDAAFANAGFGGRIDATGRFFITRGGAWEPLELPGAPTPYLVYPVGDELEVWTDQGVEHRVNARGEVFAPSDDDEATERSAPSPELIARAHRRAVFLEPRSPFTTDGRVLAFDLYGGAQVLPGGSTIALPSRIEESSLGALNVVRVGVWGTSFVAFSDAGWVRSDGTAPFAPFAEGVDGELVFDDAGRRFVREGRCPDTTSAPAEQPDDAESAEEGDDWNEESGDEYGEYEEHEEEEEEQEASVCVFDGERRTEVSPGGSFVEVLGIASDQLYVLVEGQLVRRIDLATGAAVDVGETVTGEQVLGDLRVTPDGAFQATVEGEHRWGPSWEAMRPVRLPARPDGRPWSLHVLDARRAVAFRDRRVLVTEDGGETFTELSPARWDGAFTPSDDCNAHGCVIGRTLWAPASFTPPSRPVAAIEGAAPRASPDGLRVHHELSLACEVPPLFDGHPLDPPPLAAYSPRSMYGRGWVSLRGSGPFAAGTARGELGGTVAAEPFRASVGGTVPALAPLEEMRASAVHTDVELVIATPRVAVLERRVTDDRYEIRDLVVLPVGGRASVVGPFLDLVSTWDESPVVGGALPVGEGAVVWITHSSLAWAAEHAPDVLVVVDADGEVALHRFESGVVPTRRALARDGAGHPGLHVQRAGEAFFLGTDGSVRSAPPLPDEVAAICGAIDPASFEVVAQYEARVSLRRDDGLVAPADLELSLAPDGSACVRRASAPYFVTDEEPRAALLIEAEAGRLLGRLASSAGTSAAFACELDRPRTPGYEAESVRLAPLEGGAVGLAVHAGRLVLGTLREGTWELAAADPDVYLQSFTLSDVGDGPLVLAQGATTVRVLPAGATPLAEEVVAEALGTVLRRDAASRELVATRGSERGAPVRFEDRWPLSATLGRHASGLAGILTTCRSIFDVDYLTWGECQVHGVEVNETGITTHAAYPIHSTDAWQELVLADPAGRLGVLARVEAEGESVRLELLALDGARAERVGASIVGTAEASPRPVAAVIAGSTRVAYLDGRGPYDRLSHLRVVELRGGAWWDVAPPLPVFGEVGATFVGQDLVVVMATNEAAASHRLHDGVWQPLPISMPRLAEPE